jgi:hypothetical protein
MKIRRGSDAPDAADRAPGHVNDQLRRAVGRESGIEFALGVSREGEDL